MPFQFTFTKLRFFFLILSLLVAALLLFAVGRVTGGGADGGSATAGGPGTPGAAGGQTMNGKMAARNAQVLKATQVQGLLGIPQAPGQAQAMRGMYTATALTGMASTPNGAAPAGQQAAQPGVAQAAAPGTVPAQTQAAVPGGANAGANPPAAGAAVPAGGPAGTAPAGAMAADPAAPAIPVRVAFATAPDGAGEPYVLQFGAFREQKEAKDLQARLLKLGLTTVIIDKNDDKNDAAAEDIRPWHTVRYGGFKDISAASKEAAVLTDKVGILALVRSSDSI
jgi:cell division septation protein DedD